ncbi:MAG TPA: aminotransferase class V-fold PLP-dependent enzyme [Chloroflexota bacterium]|nr:aminotransferase class V-fold PLP-dependent enzyme [Chloroflexota bacterium]
MSIYEELGVRPIINAAGTQTRFGGAPLPEEVVASMAEASASCVRMEELEEAAGRVIAEVTGAEAGYVTAGAAAGITLAVAACLVRFDVARMDRLPDTTGMPNEVVVQRAHRNAYDHAVRAAGARFVEVGYLGYPGAGGTHPWQIEAAISERTVALYWACIDAKGVVSLEDLCRIAHRHKLPVIVDASAALPPAENLRRFIHAGADLVCFSGGKAIRGPQASGILCGRRDLIESVLLQHQDMDVHPETWSYRSRYLETGILPGPPHQGLGRGFKVGKEEIVGLVTALRLYVARDHEAERARWERQVWSVLEGIGGLAGVKGNYLCSPQRPVPTARLELDEATLGLTALDVIGCLLRGNPPVAVNEGAAREGALVINPMSLKEGDISPLVKRLREVLGGAKA